MRPSLSIHERKATAFMGVTFVGILSSLVALGIHKRWFQPRSVFSTIVTSADGVHPGTAVEMAGLRVGVVEDIEIDERNEIRVRVAIFGKYRKHVRADTRFELLRPYVIGDKILSMTLGSPDSAILEDGREIPSREVLGLTDLLNGKKLIPYMATMEQVAAGLKTVADSLFAGGRSPEILRAFSSMPALITQSKRLASELSELGHQLNDGSVRTIARNLAATSEQLRSVTASPAVARDITAIVGNLALMTDEVKKVLPAFSALAPELPKSSQRVVQALDEAVVVLKAMQKTFLLSSSVREVREEESRQEKSKAALKPSPDSESRQPASAPKP